MPWKSRQILLLAPALCTLALCVPVQSVKSADETSVQALEQAYTPNIKPVLKKYCYECHSGDRVEADIDLEAFKSFGDIRKHAGTWQKVGDMLESGQMPPKDAAKPTDAERADLQKWVRGFLTMEASARAGDPGKVVLRRLSNAEYTYTLRDLTGVESLDPAREFPVDGAAGEGFTNTGNALVMSPALLTKYLDAAKDVADHAMLLPDGIRFSPLATRRDWTNETVDRIRQFYRDYSDARGGAKVNLQGIVFETNTGGRLPLDRYLAATLMERDALSKGVKSIETVASEHGLNAKYLGILWNSLTDKKSSLLLDSIRTHWRTAQPADVMALVDEIAQWQNALFRFGSVGHIGKVGGPKRWLEPVSPLVTKQEIRFPIQAAQNASEVTLALVATDAGDGKDHDYVIWQQPRLVAPGKPDLLLRDVRDISRILTARRAHTFSQTTRYLKAAHLAAEAQGRANVEELAKNADVDPATLAAWLDYLGIGSGGVVELKGHFTTKLESAAGYDFVKGWGSHDTPLLLANSSDQHVRVPGNMKPHGVTVHPSPTLRAAVGWRSPITAQMKIQGAVTHAHPECGNGVTWSVELRRGATRQRLIGGAAQGAGEVKFGPLENVAIQPGDLVSLLIGPRDGNHSCDLTAVDLQLTDMADAKRVWNLAADVSGDILAGNPHADRMGNAGIWHFYTEPEKAGSEAGPVIPAASLLAKWTASKDAEERGKLAEQVQALLTSAPPAAQNSPDAALYRQLASLGGPLFGNALKSIDTKKIDGDTKPDQTAWGLDPALFGKHPNGGQIDASSLCVQAPSALIVRFPADLVAGRELVVTGSLDPQMAAEGSVQLQVVSGQPSSDGGLVPSGQTVTIGNGQWTSDNRKSSYSAPIVVNEGTAARQRISDAFDEFRNLFPMVLCYTKIVPVDEVVTLTLFYREDDHLARLMLNDKQKAELDRLWDELHYVSQDALTLVDAYLQLMEYATQDADPKVFEPMRKPINDRAAAYRKRLVDTEPAHLNAVLELADRAYRRPLTAVESQELRVLYSVLRKEELPHEEAIRLLIARVLVAPAFLYKTEKPVSGNGQGAVTDFELANRLSYFLWSSQPDAKLRRVAAAGQLHQPAALMSQARRMLQDGKTRRLATEFACQWLHIHDFDHLDEKSERHFPTFLNLRGAMYEESIRFFTNLFQNDGTVLDILNADYTFLNEDLAKHYDVPGVTGPEWRKVDGLHKYNRGGILGQATTLAKQSGASRTSPILRGNWVSEVLLGERLPRPPKGVPILPDDEAATAGLTVRQLVEQHANDPKCSVCHRRIDPMGFSLEGFDAIGKYRTKDLGDRAIDTHAVTMDGAKFEGLAGLRDYLLTARRDAFVRQFCRKLLGYSLGRAVQLSDEPLLSEMQQTLKANDYKIMTALETIICSRQFREIRGRETAYEE